MAQRPSYASISHRESFCHERLKLAENSIRLFQIHGGNKDEPIRLQITQYASHRRPPYRAISYTWGTAANLHDIVVNGRGFRIHQNLWTLLFHLRLRKESAFFWADALCIDQANLRERNFHVQLMGKIYEQAKSVLVWLGMPSPDRTEIRAMDFIRDMTFVRKSHGDIVFANNYTSPDIKHRWEALLRMCQHQYWTRTWIVQEFIRAPQVEVVCGSSGIDWSEFESLLLAIQSSPFNQMDFVLQILQSRPARLTLRRRARTASTLHELLGEYHDSRCTEQRDKVYGILGLASDCGEDETTGVARGMIPDYNKHIVEVYLDAVACIERSLPSRALLPSVANLVRQTLLLTESDFASYVSSGVSGKHQSMTLNVRPDYVGIIDHVMPSWTSVRDLKLQLASIDWGQYIGYEVKTRPGSGRRSSRAVHSAIPDNMIRNVVNAVETESRIRELHNYPCHAHVRISPEHIALHSEDKRLYDNPSLDKPRLILEHSQALDSIRLGLACTSTQRGDLILQFQGLDVALICRMAGNDLFFIGKAVMIKHAQLQHDYGLDSVCVESRWFSPCPYANNPEEIYIETDALSLAEILAQ